MKSSALLHIIFRGLKGSIGLLAAFVFSVQPLSACQCPPGSPSVCQSFLSSDVVFTGRVESIQPNISLVGPSLLAGLRAPISEEELEKLETDKSLESFLKLKEIYSELWPEPERSQLARSSTREQLDSTFEAIMERGKKARFRVSEIFSGPELKTVDVWTDFTCGDRFQEGEFYLV